jgi:hypothetical protein
MRPTRHRLDEPVGPNGESRARMILAAIRAGGFPDVAAEAYGLSADLLHQWLRRGRLKKGSSRFRRFAAEVRQAAAQARLKAEIDVLKADARFWLRHGPGRETADARGWTTPAKPQFQSDRGADLLASPAWSELWLRLLRALTPYPEARAATAAVLYNEESGVRTHLDRHRHDT